MSDTIKDLADLKKLGKTLKKQREEREAEERVRIRREREVQEEANLFRDAIGDVMPLANRNRAELRSTKPKPIPLQRQADDRAALKESMSDEFDVTTLLDIDDSISYTRKGVGLDVVRKLRRGHWVIQDEIDLHGMRRDEARDALGFFLKELTRRGLRCARIVHGKGLGSVNREPVLKKMVYKWLVQKDEVIAFCQAKAIDGGSGALIVLLKGRSNV